LAGTVCGIGSGKSARVSRLPISLYSSSVGHRSGPEKPLRNSGATSGTQELGRGGHQAVLPGSETGVCRNERIVPAERETYVAVCRRLGPLGIVQQVAAQSPWFYNCVLPVKVDTRIATHHSDLAHLQRYRKQQRAHPPAGDGYAPEKCQDSRSSPGSGPSWRTARSSFRIDSTLHSKVR
jgi:hypothetical protein